MQTLPVGIQSFETIRNRNYLYVDKTAELQKLIESGERYFLSRPCGFGKSMTLSTIYAMFSGKVDMFKGLAAEKWVKKQAKSSLPVLCFDMSALETGSVERLEFTLKEVIKRIALFSGMDIHAESLNGQFSELIMGTYKPRSLDLRSQSILGKITEFIKRLFQDNGPVVVLIDEYDKPILDNIGNIEKLNEIREVMRSFYSALRSCDKYLRFVMLTGTSKFSKNGVFSDMNNFTDISMDKKYGDIVGYTHSELEKNFSSWISYTAKALSMDKQELLDKIEDSYGGFCFDGKTKLYNPFSVLNFFYEQKFKNYWYQSLSPSFLETYIKQHAIKSPEKYRHIEVSEGFMDTREIEESRPESFLYQSGYLTIEEDKEQSLILDCPNQDVLSSLSCLYLEHVYNLENYENLGSQIWKALKERDIAKVVEVYNAALAAIPYDNYADQGESWYRSLFLMLLRGAGITSNGEILTNTNTNDKDRSDVIVQFQTQVVILEFKYAKESSEVDSKRSEGENYAIPDFNDNREVTTAVIVIDGEKHLAV